MKALKPFALPLHSEAVRVEPQNAYDRAYRRGAVAGLIASDGRYTQADLPFPSLLSNDQRRSALAAVRLWQTELERLAHGT